MDLEKMAREIVDHSLKHLMMGFHNLRGRHEHQRAILEALKRVDREAYERGLTDAIAVCERDARASFVNAEIEKSYPGRMDNTLMLLAAGKRATEIAYWIKALLPEVKE